MEINDLDKKKYIKGFISRQKKKAKQNEQITLFPPPIIEAMKQKRCPYCGNKLRAIKDGTFYMCNNYKKHTKTFIVSSKKLYE